MLQDLATWAQIVSIPIAIIAIVVAIVLYRRSKKHKALACIFDPLVTPVEIRAGDALRGDIEIQYRGNPVQGLFVARATIKSSGTLPILTTDAVEPITFSFSEGSELLREPRIIESSPEGIEIAWSFTTDRDTKKIVEAQLMFDLLNPEDQFSIEFVCSGEKSLPSVSTRIAGVSNLQVLDSRELKLREEIRSNLSYSLPMLAGFATVALIFPSNRLIPGFLIGALVGSVSNIMSPVLRLVRFRRSQIEPETSESSRA